MIPKKLRGEKKQTEGGEAVVGAGQVWNWFYVSARRGFLPGLSYTRESEEEEEEESAGVSELSLLLSVSWRPGWLAGWCLQFPLDTLQRARRPPSVLSS